MRLKQAMGLVKYTYSFNNTSNNTSKINNFFGKRTVREIPQSFFGIFGKYTPSSSYPFQNILASKFVRADMKRQWVRLNINKSRNALSLRELNNVVFGQIKDRSVNSSQSKVPQYQSKIVADSVKRENNIGKEQGIEKKPHTPTGLYQGLLNYINDRFPNPVSQQGQAMISDEPVSNEKSTKNQVGKLRDNPVLWASREMLEKNFICMLGK